MDNQGGMETGLRIISYLISGLLLYGGLGWLADHLLHTTMWLPVGLILGAVLGIYLVIRRYGQS